MNAPASPPRSFRLKAQGTLLLALVALVLWIWRSELFTVARPGERPRALEVRAASQRQAAGLDVVLPAVPAGMQRLKSGEQVLLVHYWAPWERHSRAQVQLLDSLRRAPGLERLQVVVVCFDPFPSVARYVARHRLRLAVLLDGPGELRERLPCPSIPFTYVLDAHGRIAVAQAGEVDWWAPATMEVLKRLLAEPAPRSPPATVG